jgi:hypothetical protein
MEFIHQDCLNYWIWECGDYNGQLTCSVCRASIHSSVVYHWYLLNGCVDLRPFLVPIIRYVFAAFNYSLFMIPACLFEDSLSALRLSSLFPDSSYARSALMSKLQFAASFWIPYFIFNCRSVLKNNSFTECAVLAISSILCIRLYWALTDLLLAYTSSFIIVLMLMLALSIPLYHKADLFNTRQKVNGIMRQTIKFLDFCLLKR